jgi:hypothetical protein
MAAASAAAQACQSVFGHGLLPATPNAAPVRNPTMAPRIMNAFMRFLNRVLAGRLPLLFSFRNRLKKPMFTGDFPAETKGPIPP